MRPNHRSAVLLAVLLAGLHARAATTVAVNPDQDSVVATGIANAFVSNNYGLGGATSVSGPGAGKGEARTLTRFDTSMVKSSFDTEFGVGNWSIDSVSLRLVAQAAGGSNPLFNNPNVAGQFLIEWVPADNWVEGTGTPASPSSTGVNWTDVGSLGSGAESVGLQNYGGGSGAVDYLLSPSSGLLLDIFTGSTASFMLSAVSPGMTVIFNSRSNGTSSNWPQLGITASAVPEPGRAMLLAAGLLALGLRRHRGKARRRTQIHLAERRANHVQVAAPASIAANNNKPGPAIFNTTSSTINAAA